MNIGVISDTHGLVRPEVYKVFDGVDLILHAGDIGGTDVIIELEAIAPVKAVTGNMDAGQNLRLPEKTSFQLQDRNFQLQHIFPTVPAPEDSPAEPIRNIIVFGHTHKPSIERGGDTLYFNPGSAGPRRFLLPVCVGKLRIDGEKVEGEIIHLKKVSQSKA